MSLLAAGLVACTGDSADLASLGAPARSDTAPAERPADWPDTRPARPQLPAGVACGWQVASDINLTNVLFPDEAAQYWVSVIPHLPGTRLRIDGRYGHMRYFSFNVYDPLIRPVDALADEALQPDDGRPHPFIDPTAPLGGGYTAYVEFGPKPDTPAPNTLYSGEIPTGSTSLPNPAGMAIFYRSYVPEEGFGFDGGVGLPHLTLETADGRTALLAFADCAEPLLPTAGGLLPDPGLNDLLLGLDLPDALLGAVNVPTAVLPPRSSVFYSLPTTLLQIVGNALGISLGESANGLPLTSGGGFGSNLHNAYISIGFSRYFGSAYVVRGRAPSWRGAPGVPWGTEQLRYWSICQNEFVTQRYVACAHDDQVALDDEGFFTVLVTDPAERPAWAVTENGITWLPWGPFPDGLIIYRHMLPDPDFAQAIQKVPQGTPPEELLGDYSPVGAYCDPAQLAQPAATPRSLFETCLDTTLQRGEQSGLLPPG